MRSSHRLALAALPWMVLTGPAAAPAEHRAVTWAEQAIAAGRVEPERDLEPLLEAVGRPAPNDERRQLVAAVAELGECDGASPNAVKRYLAEAAVPVLLRVVETGGEPFLQGDALAALRGLCVQRSVLVRAAGVAEASPDEFVRSRGEILRNFVAGLPVEDETRTMRAVDPASQRLAIAYLDKMHVGVSTAALRSAARDAMPELVAALLDAGVAPDTGVTDLQQTPLYLAVFIGCSSQGAETDWLVETVQHLVRAGADLARVDDNRNTALLHAAHACGPKIVGLLLDAGAKIDVRNGSGTSPLTMALTMHRLETAELLVARGARLSRQEAEAALAGATDEPTRAIVRRASGGR